ncbi:class I SAM-dependent methyltransferase [Ruminococcaceae bacterium OttesenSCG-928-I18]|nr:class I SAM-dependent methyltransferase [Ruminococcaceae bacterium OttesenSCG-928-I18]
MGQPKLEENLKQWNKIDRYSKWMYHTYCQYIGKRVLDIGVGIGNMTQFYIHDVDLAICADIFDSQLGLVSERFSDFPVETLKLDIENDDICELKTYELDTVICINVLEHIENHQKALQNMRDAICDNGKIIILVPALSKLYNEMDKNAGHYRRYDKGQLEKLGKETDLNIIHQRYFNMLGVIPYRVKGKGTISEGNTFSSTLNEGSSKMINYASHILEPIEKIIKIPFGLSEVIVFEK